MVRVSVHWLALVAVVVWAAAGLAPVAMALPSELYVDAAHGSDLNPGTATQPFATPQRAQAAIRSAQGVLPLGGVTVVVREGVYSLAAAPLLLNASDSGSSSSSPVRWVADTNAQPLFSSGAVLDSSKATVVNGIVQIDLRAQGITDFGTIRANPGEEGSLEPESPRAWSCACVCVCGRPGPVPHVGHHQRHPRAAGALCGRAGRRPCALAQHRQHDRLLAMEQHCQGQAREAAGWRGLARCGVTLPAVGALVQVANETSQFSYEPSVTRPSRWLEEADHAWLHGYWSFDWADSVVQVVFLAAWEGGGQGPGPPAWRPSAGGAD